MIIIILQLLHIKNIIHNNLNALYGIDMLGIILHRSFNVQICSMGYSRHKIICNVILGQMQDQGVKMSSRCLWDPDTDDWASVQFQNDSLFAIATVHGIYST